MSIVGSSAPFPAVSKQQFGALVPWADAPQQQTQWISVSVPVKVARLGCRPCWGPKGRLFVGAPPPAAAPTDGAWAVGHHGTVWGGVKPRQCSLCLLWAVPMVVALDGLNTARVHLGSMGRNGDGSSGAAGLCAGRGCRVSLGGGLGVGTHSCIPVLEKQQLLPTAPWDGGIASTPMGSREDRESFGVLCNTLQFAAPLLSPRLPQRTPTVHKSTVASPPTTHTLSPPAPKLWAV